MGKNVQKVPTGQKSIVQNKQIEGSNQSPSTK